MAKNKRRKTVDPDLDELIPLLINQWRKLKKIRGGPEGVLQTREFRNVVSAVRHLFDGTPHPEGKQWPQEDLIGGDLLYPWIIRYLEGFSLLSELPFPPRTVLEVGKNSGAFALAALKLGASSASLVGPEERPLKISAEVSGRCGYPMEVLQKSISSPEVFLDRSFDLIILPYQLSDLFPSTVKGWQKKQNAYVQKLLESLTPDGMLLIVENSWPSFNKRMLQLRDFLCTEGVPVQAPCVWQGKCPALEHAKGHCYAQRELPSHYHLKEVQRSARIKVNSLKMSYLLLRRPGSSWPSLPDGSHYRVISPPVEGLHGKRFHLCGIDGGKSLGSHLDEHPKESRAFQYLRRGDLISLEGILEDKDRLDLIEDSEIKVIAPCGKPLP